MAETKIGMIVVRCERTGNPVGTDTLKVGGYCGCKICEAVRFGEKEYIAEIERLNGEMDAIDSLLARRPALNDFITSLAKVQHAIAAAAKADVAEKEVERLKKALDGERIHGRAEFLDKANVSMRVERLEAMVENIQAELIRMKQ